MDIVERLRSNADERFAVWQVVTTMNEAADEIERLRETVSMLAGDRDLYMEEIKQKNAEIERLREALQKWWSYSQTDYDDHIQMMIDWDDAVTSTRSALQQKESE